MANLDQMPPYEAISKNLHRTTPIAAEALALQAASASDTQSLV